MNTITTFDEFLAAVGTDSETYDGIAYLHVPASWLPDAQERVGQVVKAEDQACTPLEERLYASYPNLRHLTSNAVYVPDPLDAEGNGFDDDNVGIVLEVAASRTWTNRPSDPLGAFRAAAILRVIPDPLTDETIVNLVHENVKNSLESHSKNELYDAPEGLDRYVLENSTSPVIRRLRDLAQAKAKTSLAEARYRLQVALTDSGLGRINGLDITEFEKLDSETLVKVMLAAMKAYKNTSLVGALYYVAKKGTDRSEFNAWYDQLVAKHGWTRSGVEDAFRVTHSVSAPVDAERVRKFSMNAAEAYIEVLAEVESRSDLDVDARRNFILNAFAEWETSHEIADILMGRPSRSLEELASADAGQLELASALFKAHATGISPDDESVSVVLNKAERYIWVFLIRQNGDRQMYFFEAVRAANVLADAQAS